MGVEPAIFFLCPTEIFKYLTHINHQQQLGNIQDTIFRVENGLATTTIKLTRPVTSRTTGARGYKFELF